MKDSEYNVEIPYIILINEKGDYQYKYDNGLVLMSIPEKLAHPGRIARIQARIDSDNTRELREIRRFQAKLFLETMDRGKVTAKEIVLNLYDLIRED